jgi:hypothetical protein
MNRAMRRAGQMSHHELMLRVYTHVVDQTIPPPQPGDPEMPFAPAHAPGQRKGKDRAALRPAGTVSEAMDELEAMGLLVKTGGFRNGKPVFISAARNQAGYIAGVAAINQRFLD